MAEKIDFKDIPDDNQKYPTDSVEQLLTKYPELILDFLEPGDAAGVLMENRKKLGKARRGDTGYLYEESKIINNPRTPENVRKAIERSIQLRELLKNPDLSDKQRATLESELLAYSRTDQGGRGGTKEKQAEMDRIEDKTITRPDDPRQPGIKIGNESETILDDDESGAKLSFFENLKERFKDPKNRQFLENLGMQLGVNLTRPMNPGENRSLVNQVARSVQGATDKSIVQDKAKVEAALKKAQTEKALKDAQGGTDLYKKATEFVISSGIKPTDPEYGQAVAKAMRQFGVKDITTAQVNAIIKINELEQELKLTLDPESEEYRIKQEELNALKKRLEGLDISGGSSGDGRNVVTFEDVQSGN